MMGRGKLWPWQLTCAAVVIASTFQTLLAVADDDSTAAFVRITKHEISGKTGHPMESIEVFHEGQVWLKDGTGATLATARLSATDLTAFHRLLADPHVGAASPVCAQPLGADLPEAEFILQYEWKTITLRLANHCRLPPPLAQLRNMLDEVKMKYLSGAD